MISLRTDRFTFSVGERVEIEAHICNDTAKSTDYTLVFELYNEAHKLIKRSETKVTSRICSSFCAAHAEFTAETNRDREKFVLKAVLLDNADKAVTYAEQEIEVFEACTVEKRDDVVLIEKLPVGEHIIAGEKIVVKECGMLPLHFVSRDTGHPMVSEFKEKDFSYWYNYEEDMITPILETTFTAEGFTPILTAGNMDDSGNWVKTNAVAEKFYEGKRYVICQLDLRTENPVAQRFLKKIYE